MVESSFQYIWHPWTTETTRQFRLGSHHFANVAFGNIDTVKPSYFVAVEFTYILVKTLRHKTPPLIDQSNKFNPNKLLGNVFQLGHSIACILENNNFFETSSILRTQHTLVQNLRTLTAVCATLTTKHLHNGRQGSAYETQRSKNWQKYKIDIS